MDARAALNAMGGAARRGELVALVGRREFDKAVRRRQIVRERTGVYTSGTSFERVLAAQFRGVPSHLTAAWRWNLGLARFPDRVDLTVPRRRAHRSVPSHVHLHYADLHDDEITNGVTSPLRTVVDCMRTSAAPSALAVVEDALRTGRVSIDDVRTKVQALRGPGSTRARQILGWVDLRAESPLESALRGILLEAGITRFQPQFPVYDGEHRVARADLGDPTTRVVLEAEGFLWHGQREQLSRDAQRYDDMVALGYRVLRFTSDHLADRPAWVLETVRRTLAMAGS
jgi:very-short-patch-repair endonuclease